MGNERLLLGYERLLLGVIRVFGVFGIPFFVAGGFWDPVGRRAPQGFSKRSNGCGLQAQKLSHHVMPKLLVFKGSRTSCREINFGIFWPNFGRKRSHHVMDASCRFLFTGSESWMEGGCGLQAHLWCHFGRARKKEKMTSRQSL